MKLIIFLIVIFCNFIYGQRLIANLPPHPHGPVPCDHYDEHGISICPSEYPSCIKRKMTVNDVGFGKLNRSNIDENELVYTKENDNKGKESLLVILRLYLGRKEHYDQDRYDIPAATLYSFAQTLDKLDSELRKFSTIIVLLNGTEDLDEGNDWREYIQLTLAKRIGTLAIYSTPKGNLESYQYMMTLLDHIFQDKIEGIMIDKKRTIIYFLEDDYLHKPESTRNLIDIFNSHEPCIAVPYDYPDRYWMQGIYNDDDGHVSVLAGRYHHWRTIKSTTVTFAARAETIHALWATLPTPSSDFWNSYFMSTYLNVSILSPLPGLSSHTESYSQFHMRSGDFRTSSLYHPWMKMGRKIVKRLRSQSGSLWERRDRRRGTWQYDDQDIYSVDEDVLDQGIDIGELNLMNSNPNPNIGANMDKNGKNSNNGGVEI